MGLSQGTLKVALRGQSCREKCVPLVPYQPLHDIIHHQVESGGLVMELKAIPLSLVRGEIPEGVYWWTDAQFLPYNDAQIVVTASAFIPRPLHAWVKVEKVPQGRIILYSLKHQPLRGEVFRGTQSSVYPKVQPHPLGQAIGYAGSCEVNIVSLRNDTLYTKMRDMSNRTHHFVAISPNGLHLATLSKGQGFYCLEIFQFDISLISVSPHPIECHKLSPGFKGNRFHNDQAECKWSPDSIHIALSSSMGKLFVAVKAGMKNVCDVCPDLLESDLSTAASYDFDPRTGFSVLAVGTADNTLNIVNISTGENGAPIVAQRNTEENIDCVQYNQDGSALAASFRSFVVKLYDTAELTELHTISMADRCPDQVSRFAGSAYPSVMRLSFTFDGRFLATSSCDGMVRIWAIPKLLSLQECCRKVILSSAPIQKIRSSSLPRRLKAYLLSEFF